MGRAAAFLDSGNGFSPLKVPGLPGLHGGGSNMLKQATLLASLEGMEKLGQAEFSSVDSTIVGLAKAPWSQEGAVTHTAIMTVHLARKGLTINDAKSRFTPLQCTVYLGLQLYSSTMRAYLSDDRVAAIQGCLSLFRQGPQVTLLLCLKLLGLMAAPIQLGLLRMRPLQSWLNAFHLNPKRDRH
ncbi:UNVERIFIED_CONTAM: hypothetical protein FKN15_013095 [Acipenser sinensis]